MAGLQRGEDFRLSCVVLLNDPGAWECISGEEAKVYDNNAKLVGENEQN